MTARELAEKSLPRLRRFDVRPYLPALRGCNDGALGDILNTNGCAYYQWTPGLIELVKPKQIVELGGAMGAWSLMALNGPYQDFDLWSITLPEGGLEFSFIQDAYPNFHPIVADDLDLANWPKELDLAKTDLWFLDSEHTYEQLKAEIELYTPFFKKGAVLLFDDIRMPQLTPLWDGLPHDKCDMTDPLHYSGYGLCIV